MPGYSEVCIWFPTIKLTALKQALATDNAKVEDRLLEKLEELYCNVVPHAQRASVDADLADIIKQEQEDEALRRAERYRESVLSICGAGYIRHWKIGADVSDLHVARILRKALRLSEQDPATFFENLLGEKQKITQSEFAQAVQQYLQGEKPMANAVILNFDTGRITLFDPQAEEITYRMKEVSTAVYQAERAKGIPEGTIALRFYRRLAERTMKPVPSYQPDTGDDSSD